MIGVFYFTMGFVVYILFNVVTFAIFSKAKERVIAKKFFLFLIYLYYSILAIYLIWFVENRISGAAIDISVVFVESMTFLVAGGLFNIIFYKDEIEERM